MGKHNQTHQNNRSSTAQLKTEELKYGLHHLAQHNATTQYPNEGTTGYNHDYSVPRYAQTSPDPAQRQHNTRNMMRQVPSPFHGVSEYSQEPQHFSQENGNLGGFDVRDPSSRSAYVRHSIMCQDAFAQYYETQNSEGLGGQFDSIELYQSPNNRLSVFSASDNPYQPDGSLYSPPPTPTPSVQSQEIRRTRSGRPIMAADTKDTKRGVAARAAKPPKPKKAAKQGKGDKPKVPRLNAPLSELTNGFEHIPVRNMEEWVNRPVEVRRQEVEKRNGYVTRPMNSFMLYRSAYAERTKLWCLQNNHQVVSSVSGVSWPLEPPEIRDKYNELARTERTNHQIAHPGYKFSPSKAQNTKRKFSEDEDSELSDLDDPNDDYGRAFEARRRKRKGKHSKKYGKEAGYPVNSMLGLGDHFRQRNGDSRSGLNKSSYQATNPGKPLPAAMDTTGLYGHYYQATVRQNTSVPNVEDVTMRKTETPGMHYSGTPPLISLPGGQHYDLMQMSFSNDIGSMDHMKVDPSLLEYDNQNKRNVEDPFGEDSLASLNNSFMGHGTDGPFASPYTVDSHGAQEGFHDYLGPRQGVDHQQLHRYSSGDQGLQSSFDLLSGSNNHNEQWHMHEPLDPGSEYDKWMDDKTAIN